MKTYYITMVWSNRFSISFSSWDYELSRSTLLLLDQIEEACFSVSITNVIYNYLNERVSFIGRRKN